MSFAPPSVGGVTSEAVEPEPTPQDPGPAEREAALAARLDHLEHVLREELARQKQRADRAEAQLRALGDLDEQASDLVSEARAEASKVLEAARHAYEQAAGFRQEAEAVLRQAGHEAAKVTREASLRATTPTVPGPGALDRELLEALRDHLIDTRALYAQLTAETREAVIRLIQAASQARGKPPLREVPYDDAFDLEQARG